MDPLHLLHILQQRGAISRVKDMKTSLQKLADASQVPLARLDLGELQLIYQDRLRAYFGTLTPPASLHTQRNTLQNLRQFYRSAQTEGLLKPKDGVSVKREHHRRTFGEMQQTSPYREHYPRQPYRRPQSEWPADILEGWERYRLARVFEVRPITLRGNEQRISDYVGYCLTFERLHVERWEQLFEVERLTRFCTWHAARVKAPRLSTLGREVVTLMMGIAQQQERPESAMLRKLYRKLPRVLPMHDTERPEHTCTPEELDGVGLAWMDRAKAPVTTWKNDPRLKSYGLRQAMDFQTGLIIRFLVRIPMRSRAIREMDLGGRLYRDDHGIWMLAYRGEQLKVSAFQGQINEFRCPWPDDLVQDLETYLEIYRPRIPFADRKPEVFLSGHGNVMHAQGLTRRLQLAVYIISGKRVWPHLFRTTWADHFLDQHPGEYETVAAILNNTPQMVMERYRRFRREQHLQKALDFNTTLFGNGHGKGKTP